MIYFVTNDKYHLEHYGKALYDNIEVLPDNVDTINKFKDFLTNEITNILGYDVESNGLDAWMNSTILKIFGNENTQYVFHSPYCDISNYLNIINNIKPYLLGHNIKFDLKFLLTEDKIYYSKVWDTMIAEQRIYMKSGMSSSLENLCLRYLKVYPDVMDKKIREEFIGADIKKFKIKPRHIYYAASDVANLFPIMEKQRSLLTKYELEFLVYDIEFPLIAVIAKAEVTGFEFNQTQWMEIYRENKEKLFKIECKLDEEVRRLRDLTWGTENDGISYIPEKRFYMVGGKWDNIRKKNVDLDIFNDDGTTNVLDLFGDMMSINSIIGSKAKAPKKIKRNLNNINYNSDVQIVEVFARLEQPLPTDKGNLIVPTFNKKGKIDKTYYSYKTGEGVLKEYLIHYPGTIMKDFITLLLEHRKFSTACNNFGANFIKKINPVTNRIHTVFRQCFASTGRFQSGGGKKEPDKPNFQNIPSKADYAVRMRNCFKTTPDRSIGTHDLSGAELIIMCSLSQDMKLLKISKEDMHSYVAQGCWRLIFNYRARLLINRHESLRAMHGNDYRDEQLIKDINDNITLSKDYVVSQTENKKVRTNHKPMTFGVFYGMYADKAGKTLNITKEEGQIIIDFIEREFPDVIRMVKNAAAFARRNGYVILNNRTNSRAWFPTIVKVLRGELNERHVYGALSKEQSEARNIRIQGTQADMIKECTVILQKWIEDNGYFEDIVILSWVHDEIIDEHPSYLDGKSESWKYWKKHNEDLFYQSSFTGKVYYADNFPAIKAEIMKDVCNQYLENVTMDVSYDVEPYWTK